MVSAPSFPSTSALTSRMAIVDRMVSDLPDNERSWLADYNPRDYDPIAVTVDVVALTIRDRKQQDLSGTVTAADSSKALHVLLVRRGDMPYAGRWALPGGFVRAHTTPDGSRHEEDLHEAAIRELAEETNLTASGGPVTPGLPHGAHLEQLGTYGAPRRDPRMRIVSVAHLVFAPDLPDPTAGGDAAAAAWVPIDAFDTDELAFDHAQIFNDGLDRARSKIEYTNLATAFTQAKFTMTELREVYELVWQEPLHAANFHRKVLSVPGFVEDTGETTESGGRRGGRRARLYRAGTAKRLHPALLRPSREDER